MLKAKKISRPVRILCALLMLTLLLPFGMAANAGNVIDHLHLRVKNGVAISTDATSVRPKEDYTCSYAYNDASNVPINNVHVMGKNSEGWANTGAECTAGSYLSLPIGSAKFFPNWVKERSYQYAGFVFNFQYTYVYLHIYWSPDSVGGC